MSVRACVHTGNGWEPHAMEGSYTAMQAFRNTPIHVILFLFDVKCRQLPQEKDGKNVWLKQWRSNVY